MRGAADRAPRSRGLPAAVSARCPPRGRWRRCEAQAVAARTYAAYDVRALRACAPTATATSPTAPADQTYIGCNREGGTDGDRWVTAVDATAGEVVTYRGARDPGLLRGLRRRALRQRRRTSGTAGTPPTRSRGSPACATRASPTARTRGPTGPRASTPPTSRRGSRRTRARSARSGASTRSSAATAAASSARWPSAGRVGDGRPGTELKAALGLVRRARVDQQRPQRSAARSARPTTASGAARACRPRRSESVDGGSAAVLRGGRALPQPTARPDGVAARARSTREFRAVDAAAGVLGVPIAALRRRSTRRSEHLLGLQADHVRRRAHLLRRPAIGAHALWGTVLDAYLDHGGAAARSACPTTRVARRASAASGPASSTARIACRRRRLHRQP